MPKNVISSLEKLLSELAKIHIPEEYLKYFELYEVKDKPDSYELILHEKKDRILSELKDKSNVGGDFFLLLSVSVFYPSN